jgi:hypothetical protein
MLYFCTTIDVVFLDTYEIRTKIHFVHKIQITAANINILSHFIALNKFSKVQFRIFRQTNRYILLRKNKRTRQIEFV